MSVTFLCTSCSVIGVTWGGGRARRGNVPLILFLITKIIFFWLPSWRGANKKKLGWEWGEGVYYIKDWFKPMFPFFLTWLLIPMVDFVPPTPRLLAKLRLSSNYRLYRPHHMTRKPHLCTAGFDTLPEFGDMMTRHMNLVIWWHVTWIWWYDDTSHEFDMMTSHAFIDMTHRMNSVIWHITWIWWYDDTSHEFDKMTSHAFIDMTHRMNLAIWHITWIWWYDTSHEFGDMAHRMNLVILHITWIWWYDDTHMNLIWWHHMNLLIWHIAWIWWYDTSHEFGDMTHRMNLVIWWLIHVMCLSFLLTCTKVQRRKKLTNSLFRGH
jgi:hypothetical protein